MNLKVKRSDIKRMWIILSLMLCITILIGIILPPSKGKTKPFHNSKGNVLSGSISEKIFVEINGTKLGMFIMGEDNTKPVLLFLGGGPGIPEYFLECEYPTQLAKEFVVCYLEYRGTSLSYYSDMTVESMTTEQYLSDVVEVTNYLRDRFDQNKIYLMGHSFGTYIGLQAAYQYPELYHAYIAMSQLANQRKSEKIAYQYMLKQYRLKGDFKKTSELDKYPILQSEEAYQSYFTSSLRDNAMHDLGIGTTRNIHSVVTGIFLPSLRCTDYTPMERINIWRSKAFIAPSPVAVARTQFNAFEEVPCLEIPIYFFGGIYDYTCCYSLQKEYYNAIQAPLKGFYTFNNSAHSPLFEEPNKAMKILKLDVLNGTTILEDKK